MKKLVLSLSLVLAFSSATVAFAAIPQNIRIGTDPTYAPFESKNSQGELVGFDIDLAESCANASIRNVRLSKTHWMR